MSNPRPSGEVSPSSPADPARTTALFLIVRHAPAPARHPPSPAPGEGGRGVRADPAPDWPAAHSMDTVWYAVDGKGAVAFFDSGSPGPVPKSATRREHGDLPRLVRILGGECDDEDFDMEEAFAEAARRGVFGYQVISWECDFVDTYERVAAPKKPLHVDELPPKLRKNAVKCTLPTVDFAKETELQILGLVTCDLYWDEAVGCFAPGHKEVRPIPGKEAEYRKALPRLREENPDFQFADVGPDAGKEPPKKRGDT